MRLRSALAASAASAALSPVLALLGATPAAAGPPQATSAPAPAGRQALEPHCGDPDSRDFPIEARVHGGPDAYAPGGDWQTWRIDLHNTTNAACGRLHPVTVLVDQRRAIDRTRIGLEFFDPAARSWRPVTLETTDQHEQIGVFGDGKDFQGFDVPARGTVTVRVRMRFADGVAEDRVRVSVATVQRRDDDGDWVGESNTYDFEIRHQAQPPGEREQGSRDPADPQRPDSEQSPGAAQKGKESPLGADLSELARTGREALPWLAALAGACILGGAALVRSARRRAG